MATWPKKPRLLGTRVKRLDGPEKSTGRAKYSYDINRPGMLHAVMVRSPHAHCKITKLDSSAAEKSPGFKALHVVKPEGSELYYAGDEILAIAADTEEHAQDAARALRIEFEQLPFFVRVEDVLKAGSGQTVTAAGPGGKSNLPPPTQGASGDVAAGMKDAIVAEGTYGVSAICHQCLESHGLVAEWDGDKLTVWASTQAVPGTAQGLATALKVPPTNVRCITQYMGGGFGSKFGPDIQGIVAAELARKANAPVKLMLDRADEITVGGLRPSSTGTVRIAGTKDGKIVAFDAVVHGTAGLAPSPGVNFQLLPYIYADAIPNIKKSYQAVRLNIQQQRAMRAPGHPQSCFITECAVDDLAAKLGMDPLELRLKNLPPNDDQAAKNDPINYRAIRNTLYTKEIQIAADLMGWKRKWHAPGAEKGPIKTGLGMGLHTWGGAGRGPNDVRVSITADGSVLCECSTQDLGTGERTVLAIVIAEVLGLQPGDVTVRVGESQYGRSTGSGGSTTCPGTSPAALNAATAALEQLFEKIAPRLKAKKEDLAIEPGKIVDKGSNKSYSWKEAVSKLGMDVIDVKGDFTPGLSKDGVGGVQMAEVRVDTETGVVRCTKFVAVQDCGLIVNKLGCESQVAGGVIMGLNYALFEELIMDPHTGRQVNADMEFYKLGGIEDMPEIIVHMHDMPERGVIGIGEPPTVSTAAAVSNAVHNAIGVRVSQTPFSPDRVLEALSKGGKA